MMAFESADVNSTKPLKIEGPTGQREKEFAREIKNDDRNESWRKERITKAQRSYK